MADTGWKFPGTMVGNRTPGTADWTNPDNVKADDANLATAVMSSSVTNTKGLAASNFDFSVIPAGATIDGIEVRVGDYRISTVAFTPTTLEIRLINELGNNGAVDRRTELPDPTTTVQTNEVGGVADLWSESWSRSNVQDVDFGFFVRFSNGVGSAIFEVDFMQMRVFYHEGLPTTINVKPGEKGNTPPFKSSGGNFYAMSATSPAGNRRHGMFKTSDPTTDSWVQQDISNSPNTGSTILAFDCVSAVQDGDIIHVVFFVTGDYSYKSFNMATDLWSSAEAIETPTNAPTVPWISIAVRSDGDVVVVYAGDTDQVMGGKKERVDVNIRTGGTWGGPVALEADDGADEHYGNPNVVKGPLTDDMHIIWQQTVDTVDPPTAWQQIEARTLDPSDVLSTIDTDPIETGSALLGMQNGVSYDDAGTQRMFWIGVEPAGAASLRISVPATEDGSDDIVLGTLVETGSAMNDATVNGEVGLITVAELDGDLHVLYGGGGSGGGDLDIYYVTSTDDGATWTAEVEEIDAITVNFLSASIYTRGGDTVLAYVYDDDGVKKYNEKVLATGGATLAFGTITITGDLVAIGTNIKLTALGTSTLTGDLAAFGAQLSKGTSTLTGDLAAFGVQLAKGTITVLGEGLSEATHLALGTITMIGDLVSAARHTGITGTSTLIGELDAIGSIVSAEITANGTITISGDLQALGTGIRFALGTITLAGDVVSVGTHTASATITVLGEGLSEATHLAFGVTSFIGELIAGGGQHKAVGTTILSGDLAGVGTSIRFAQGTITMTGDLVAVGVHMVRGTITVLGEGLSEATHLAQATTTLLGDLTAIGTDISAGGPPIPIFFYHYEHNLQ